VKSEAIACAKRYWSSRGRFFVHFSGENFGENSAENFPPKNVGKNGIFRGKSFEKSFFQEIPGNFLQKVIFRRKKCTKNWPLVDKVVDKKRIIRKNGVPRRRRGTRGR
jgi:hypothetical protein